MNGAFEISALGLVAQQQALDAIASNIANINTPAFKRTDVRFSDVLARQSDPSRPRADLGGVSVLAGVSAHTMLSLDQQGELESTGQPLDLAINGRGFIELMGPRGQTMLWRGGHLSINEDGMLSGPNGAALQASIAIPTNATSISIDAEGVVRALTGDASGVVELGRIPLVSVTDASALERLDAGVYRLSDETAIETLVVGEDNAGVFVQGAMERSNVDLNEEMVRLMIVQRAYAANAQIVQAADQMMAIANGLRK